MKERLEKCKSLMNRDSVRRVILIAGALGIALIFLSNFISCDRQGEKTESVSSGDYASHTEHELEGFIDKIEGAGKTRVMLTMDIGVESVYLENGSTKTKEIAPRIRGVLVLCQGGSDPVTVGRITEAVTKALDISSAKVCVEKLSE